MVVDLDEMVLEHKISNPLKMTEGVLTLQENTPNAKNDLTYSEVNEYIANKIESHYASAFVAPLIIRVKYNDNGNTLKFRLLSTEWENDKIVYTYEFFDAYNINF